MNTIRYRSRGADVRLLEEVLEEMGYELVVSNYFGRDTHRAVLDFQLKNGLVADGIVGIKTWSKLFELRQSLIQFNDKFLSEDDLQNFADKYDLELAAVKAVNHVESAGKGFLNDGRPVILFEGHIFWRQLESKGLDPNQFTSSRLENVLYKSYKNRQYSGGTGEYDRLDKAAGMSDDSRVREAAYESASWGSFQIMGFHWKLLGYPSIESYTAHAYTHERAHLEAFGRYCDGNNLIRHLKNLDWAKFARGYNGPTYKTNKYDERMARAYSRYNDFLI